MTLPVSSRWAAFDREVPRGVAMIVPIGLCLIVLAANYWLSVYFYAAALSSDGAIFADLAHHLAQIGSPIAFDWFYPSTDIMVAGPHLLASLFNLLLGFGMAAARVTAAAILLLCFVVFVFCFRWLTGDWLASLTGAAIALAPLSAAHIEFVQIQTGYIVQAAWVAAMFTLYLRTVAARRWAWLVLFGLLAALFFAGNPLRGGGFLFGPILAAEILHLLFYRKPLNARAFLVLIAAAVLGSGLYVGLVRAGILFAIPNGYSGINLNPAALLHALNILGSLPLAYFAGPSGLGVAILGLIVFVAATAFALGFSGPSPVGLWFAAILAITALSTAFLGVLGGIFVDTDCVRYFFPALLPLAGYVVALLARARARLIPALLLLLIAVPVAASAFSLPKLWQVPRGTGLPETPNPLQTVADRLKERGIHLTYVGYLEAGILDIWGDGAFESCFVLFHQRLLPFKWNVPSECYEPRHLPDRFAVVVENDKREAQTQAAIDTLATQPETTIPAGARYTILIFKTAGADLRFLSYPILDGWRLHLPVADSMTNPQMYYRNGVRDLGNGSVAFDGRQPNGLAFGPYITLPRGSYRLTVYGSILSAAPGDAIVFINGGLDQTRIAQTALQSAAANPSDHVVAQLDFTLAHQQPLVAFAVLQTGHGRFTLSHFRIDRAAP